MSDNKHTLKPKHYRLMDEWISDQLFISTLTPLQRDLIKVLLDDDDDGIYWYDDRTYLNEIRDKWIKHKTK